MNLQISGHYSKAPVKQPSHPVHLDESGPDSLALWQEKFFEHEVTTAASSQRAQRRDITHFIMFMLREEGTDDRPHWTPRLSRAFLDYLRAIIDEKTGRRIYGDSSIKVMLAHLKTFSKWVHSIHAFPMGDPLKKVTTTGDGLELERALTKSEHRRILDAADNLLITGGLSKDRNRYRSQQRPRRKGYRAYRNRAIIYCLIETGMRRIGVVNIILDDIDFQKRVIRTTEKGGLQHSYPISREGLDAIRDYLEYERPEDFDKWQAPNLFLTASNRPKGGKLTLNVINKIWDDICQAAGVKGRTPHSARHGMGRFLIDETGNPAAVKKQLGHKNTQYSLEYMRVTTKELGHILDKRDK